MFRGICPALALDISDNSTENGTMTGVVKVFPMNTDGVKPEPLFVLEGDRSYSRFGTTLLVNATILKLLMK